MSRFIPDAKITQIHGQMQKVGKRFVIPMFHPAAALHQVRFRPDAARGFCKIAGVIGRSPCWSWGKSKTKKKHKEMISLHPILLYGEGNQ